MAKTKKLVAGVSPSSHEGCAVEKAGILPNGLISLLRIALQTGHCPHSLVKGVTRVIAAEAITIIEERRQDYQTDPKPYWGHGHPDVAQRGMVECLSIPLPPMQQIALDAIERAWPELLENCPGRSEPDLHG